MNTEALNNTSFNLPAHSIYFRKEYEAMQTRYDEEEEKEGLLLNDEATPTKLRALATVSIGYNTNDYNKAYKYNFCWPC